MNRRIVAGILTVAMLGLVLAAGGRRPSGGSAGAPAPELDSPEAIVSKLIADARAGDVPAYLDDYAGPLRARLEREADEAGRAAFADRLRAASAARKGHAVYAPEPDGPDAARVAVESVYPDRNERQVYRLGRGPVGWRIIAVEPVRGREPPARFGAPATFNEPEGVPVQGAGPLSEEGAREGQAFQPDR